MPWKRDSTMKKTMTFHVPTCLEVSAIVLNMGLAIVMVGVLSSRLLPWKRRSFAIGRSFFRYSLHDCCRGTEKCKHPFHFFLHFGSQFDFHKDLLNILLRAKHLPKNKGATSTSRADRHLLPKFLSQVIQGTAALPPPIL